jgi:hypothetical protein
MVLAWARGAAGHGLQRVRLAEHTMCWNVRLNLACACVYACHAVHSSRVQHLLDGKVDALHRVMTDVHVGENAFAEKTGAINLERHNCVGLLCCCTRRSGVTTSLQQFPQFCKRNPSPRVTLLLQVTLCTAR